MATSVKSIPSIGSPMVTKSGNISPIWYEFFRVFASNALETADPSVVEFIEDTAGEMFTSNTVVGITSTYNDVAAKVDLTVADITVTGDTGSTGVTPGDTLTIAGGVASTTTMSGDTLTVDVDDSFIKNTGDTGTGSYNFGGATVFEIPNSASPSLSVAGEIAVDTSFLNYTGLLKYHDGVEESTVVSLPTANLTIIDKNIVTYNASNSEFEMTSVTASTSVSATLTASVTQSQGNGALTSEINEISVCANTNDTVTLPTAIAGLSTLVINNGAQTLQIFPFSGDNLGLGVNTATTLAAGSNQRFTAYDATNWEQV